MLDFITETRTYVGEPGTTAVDGYAGFRIGQEYAITYLRRYDGTIVVSRKLVPGEAGMSFIYLSKEQFERWWVK